MKHLIKIESTPHGVLGVRHAGLDQQYCEAGEQVILKWQPDAKWGLQEAHYTDGDGNVTPIDLTPVKVNGKDIVVFTMPNANITVGGTFKMFVSQDWTEGTNPSNGEVLTVGNNGEPTPISVDELANEIAEGDNNLVDSIDAINPFKGWYANLATLQASHPSPVVGDYAYVKGAESTDPAAIYECTTAGSWSDSGRTADTSNVQTFASSQEVNEVHIINDLTTGGTDDVLSAEQGKILQSEIGEEKTFPELMESYQYNLTDVTYVSEFVIPKGSYIKKFRFKANAAGEGDRGIFFVKTSDNVCVYKKVINIFQQGDNEVEINQVLNYDCRLCVRSLNLYYSSGGSVPASSVFSNKLWTSDPGFPDVGTAITITKNYSGNFALSVELEWDSGIVHEMNTIENDLDEAEGNIEVLNESVGEENIMPTMLDSYPNVLTTANYVSDFVIPSNSYIDKLKFKVTDHTAQSDPGIFFLFRVSDNKCVYKQQFTYIQGDNEIKIDFRTTEDCKVGVYINYLSYVNNSALSDSSVWSMGLNQASPGNPNVGDTITISHLYSGKFALSLSLNVSSGILGELNSLSEKTNNMSDDIASLQKGIIYPHGAIICFIDDDCGKYVPSIWGEILQESPIRMGFACITGYIGGTETPPEIYEPMTLASLQSLYADGHEVYSHSYSHPAFYSQELTLEQVAIQCYKSKDWLLSNDFFRGVDILVYPGGLGENQTAKQAVVRQFYQYGVDTVGGTYNPEPLKPWTIYRKNADTATLQELKDAVDSAVANNGLLVFMNHAYELNQDKVNQVAKMIDLIDYIKTTTAEILPLNEAIHKIYGWR